MELSYKKALVIFIDLLGSQTIQQKENDFDRLLKINNIFHDAISDEMNHNKSHIIYQRHVYTFSDCAYIIYDYKDGIDDQRKDNGKLFEVALCNTQKILLKLLGMNMLFRGGCAYGDCYYDKDKNMFFGDAVIKAYKYENEVAIYPRIIVDPLVANEVISNFKIVEEQNEKSEYTSKTGINLKTEEGCIIRKDFDGEYMFHYLNRFDVEWTCYTQKPNCELLYDIVELCNKHINDPETSMKIRSKYGWLKQYIKRIDEPEYDVLARKLKDMENLLFSIQNLYIDIDI
jgi:predicted small secreted protein